MNLNAIEKFRKVIAQLEALHQELSNLARKSPELTLNNFKVTIINKIIVAANEALSSNNRPFADFAGFEADELPSVSDASLMLAQYIECSDKVRLENISYSHDTKTWVWRTDDGLTEVPTPPPVGAKK